MFYWTQDGPPVFGIENSGELRRVTLKPQETFTTNIQCRGVLPRGKEMRSLQRHDGTLMIQAENGPDDAIIIKEVPLVGQVGTCKIQVTDTELPLIVPNKQSKPLTVINLGNTPVMISASFMQDVESSKITKYFSVQPENLFLQPNETGCFFIAYRQQNPDAPRM